MLDPTQNLGRRLPIAGPYPDGTYRLEFGETLDGLAERFGLTDPQAFAEFRRLNPALAGGRALPGAVVYLPSAARASPPVAEPAPGASVETEWTHGLGRSVAGQNDFNAALEAAKQRWPRLDPLVLKSMLAQESNFKPHATNRYGYAGIAQLGVSEARSAGLETGRSRMRRETRPAHVDRAHDERLDWSKEIPAAAAVLERKAAALEPGFARYGTPAGDDFWRFVTAAYNGGEGTVLAAMRLAYGTTRPRAVEWNDLVGSPDGNIHHSPLYLACVRFFPSMAGAKFREISEYVRDVLQRARQ
jgi:hypothetical protein